MTLKQVSYSYSQLQHKVEFPGPAYLDDSPRVPLKSVTAAPACQTLDRMQPDARAPAECCRRTDSGLPRKLCWGKDVSALRRRVLALHAISLMFDADQSAPLLAVTPRSSRMGPEPPRWTLPIQHFWQPNGTLVLSRTRLPRSAVLSKLLFSRSIWRMRSYPWTQQTDAREPQTKAGCAFPDAV